MANKIVAIKLKVQQGKLQENIFVSGDGLVAADYDRLKAMVEASGELTVIGMSLIRELDPKPAIAEGTPGNVLKKQTLILERNGADARYLGMMLPEKDSDLIPVRDALLGKAIAGADVTKVSVKTGSRAL